MTTRCTDCQIRPIDRSVNGPELCTMCLNYADIEVSHFDNEDDVAHSDHGLTADNCPVCNTEIGNKRYTKRTGHTNTVAKSRTSHAGCYHTRTPAARAACRKAGGAGSPGSLALFPAPKK